MIFKRMNNIITPTTKNKFNSNYYFNFLFS